MVKKSNISVVAGGAGFVGANLVKELLKERRTIVVIDNFCRGKPDYLPMPPLGSEILVIKADLSVRDECITAFEQAASKGEIDEVWHLAANSDIPAGVADSDVDFRDTFRTTFEILRQMKAKSIKTLYFSSTSAIYGDLGERILHEDIGPLLPISNYGAMKLASEALISAAAEETLTKVCIFRFPNVVGVPATHGVIFDFINKLKVNPKKLEVLGNGTQQKSYLHVTDLVAAMLKVRNKAKDSKVNVINIGPVDQGVTVKWIAEQVVKRVSPCAHIDYGIGNKGWIGDVPKFNYSTKKLQSYGWTPALCSEDAILKAVDQIAAELGC